MVALGILLLLIGGLGLSLCSLAIFVANWRYSPEQTLLSFIPILGIFPAFNLLINNWDEVKGPILVSILMIPLTMGGAFCLVKGIGPLPGPGVADRQPLSPHDAMMETIRQNEERMRQEQDRRMRPTVPSIPKIDMGGIFGGNQSSDYTPPPPPKPDNPIFKSGMLPRGQNRASTESVNWPTFAGPELDLSGGKAIDLHGYEFMVPSAYEVKESVPLSRGTGTQWRIVGGQLDNGKPIEMIVRLSKLTQHRDGRVFAPSWSEVLGRAGGSKEDDSIQYGRIGEVPFARIANRRVQSGHGVGLVRYIGLPAPENPQQIQIRFSTHPEGFGPAHALTCEAIVRSMMRRPRVLMQPPSDPSALTRELSTASTAGLSPEDWHVRGPFAFPLGEHARLTFSQWSAVKAAWTTSAHASGEGGRVIEITLQRDDAIAVDRIRPIATEGPLRTDAVVCAHGGEASYVRLWNDEVFARIEHKAQQYNNTTYRHITYHGYLNQYRVDIALTKRDDSEITMAEIKDALLRARLAQVPQLAENAEQSDWLKEVLADDPPPFIVAGGVDATEALLLNEQGGIDISPQYDVKKQGMFAVYPELDEDDTLAGYERWSSGDQFEERLGKAETLDEIEIRPIQELRASHRPKQLSWQTKTKAGSVGMTVHVERLSVSDRAIKTPIIESNGRLRIRLGRRVVQPSQTPEVSYRELRNLRVWRVNIPASARQKIARCHYLALVPDNMIVISTSYHADRPEQLEAFDASVATLVYRGGEALQSVADSPAD